MYTFKRVLKKSDGNESVDNILQFLRVYSSNYLGLSTVELMFTRKIRSVFDKLLPKENKKQIKKKMQNTIYQEKPFSLKGTETGKKSRRLVLLINVSGE